jgi:hypothetical protein
MNFEKLLDHFMNWLPFLLIAGIIGIAIFSQFGCAITAEGSLFRFSDNIAKAMQRQPRLLG